MTWNSLGLNGTAALGDLPLGGNASFRTTEIKHHFSTMGVIEAGNSYNNRQITQEESLIYDYFLNLVDRESTDSLIDRFRRLFMEGNGSDSVPVNQAFHKIITSRSAEVDFPNVINRCCHILINRWQLNIRSNEAIIDLIELFDHPPSPYGAAGTRSRVIQRLRQLIQTFIASEQYGTLQRLATVLQQQNLSREEQSKAPLGSLIRRYPYLYEHCLLGDDSGQEHQHTIQRLQSQHQRQFELDLSQYVLYQVRCAKAARQGKEQLDALQKRIQPATNPTLLTNYELAASVRHFTGKPNGGSTYRDLAKNFHAQASYGPRYGQFKRDLHQYLSESIDPAFAKQRFNQQLCNNLQNTFSDLDHQPLSDFLMVRTCGQLLNFLVVENSRKLNHFTFVDLVGNVGATATTGLLLKVVLLCTKVKPYLEKRLAILFNHYESATQESVLWLVQVLENLNIAFSTNFGNANLSIAL
jgi:hypothetical protein